MGWNLFSESGFGTAVWIAAGLGLLGSLAVAGLAGRSDVYRRRLGILGCCAALLALGLWEGYRRFVAIGPQIGQHGLVQVAVLLGFLAATLGLAAVFGGASGYVLRSARAAHLRSRRSPSRAGKSISKVVP
jgi:hypothetical protein